MSARTAPVVDCATAAGIVAERLPWQPSVRTMQRWALAGKHGGFKSRTGRSLFRTGALKQALRPV